MQSVGRGHADLETGSLAEVLVLSEGSFGTASTNDKLTETRAITPYKWVHPDEEPRYVTV
jgi:hypothetical protein